MLPNLHDYELLNQEVMVKADLIYIIQIEPLEALGCEEVRACSEALSERYYAPIIRIVAPANPTWSNWRDYIVHDPELKEFRSA